MIVIAIKESLGKKDHLPWNTPLYGNGKTAETILSILANC
jgi:hypothetical protein